MHRLYENDDITVFWDSDKCFHAKKCVTGSPAVFDITRKPWIEIDNAPVKEVRQTVSSCPSGALTVTYNHDVRIVFDGEAKCSRAIFGDSRIGECDYDVTDDGWVIYHTEVDDEFGGKGIAKRLVFAIIEQAEKQGIDIFATCSYARRYTD